MKKEIAGQGTHRSRAVYYAALVCVIFIWGSTPVINKYLYKVYSPTACTMIIGLCSAIALLIISRKKLRLMLSRRFLAVAVPTGLINAFASIIQKIGLETTTPSRYSFLENLSCIAVPILTYFFTGRRPRPIKLIGAVLCLVGCLVLTGGDAAGGGIGIGEVLCALAGIMYGVNIAATAAFAKKLYAPLYVAMHMIIQFVVSAITGVALNYIKLGGEVIEQFRFVFDLRYILIMIAMALVSNTLCWVVRTTVIKYIDATAVAVMMPFSAVVTGVLSVLAGTDQPTLNLLFGALIGVFASVLVALGSDKAAPATEESKPKPEAESTSGCPATAAAQGDGAGDRLLTE